MKTTSLALILAAALTISACKPGQPGQVVGSTVIDCTTANLAKIAELFADLKPLVEGSNPDWSQVFTDAKAAGATIGGCALTALVQDYLGGKGAPPTSDGNAARATFEKFRAEVVGGATFKTPEGNL